MSGCTATCEPARAGFPQAKSVCGARRSVVFPDQGMARLADATAMSQNTLTPPVATEDPVLGWRIHQLEAAGYSEQESRQLAERFDIDLHLAMRLIQSGCPAETALQILL